MRKYDNKHVILDEQFVAPMPEPDICDLSSFDLNYCPSDDEKIPVIMYGTDQYGKIIKEDLMVSQDVYHAMVCEGLIQIRYNLPSACEILEKDK